MAYLIQNNFFATSGTITAAELNALGSTPYQFTTPGNFCPVGFILTGVSGTAPQGYSSKLAVFCISIPRPIFFGINSSGVGLSTIFGLPAGDDPATFSQALNVELTANNFILTPDDNLDPRPGDFEYSFKFFGFVI